MNSDHPVWFMLVSGILRRANASCGTKTDEGNAKITFTRGCNMFDLNHTSNVVPSRAGQTVGSP